MRMIPAPVTARLIAGAFAAVVALVPAASAQTDLRAAIARCAEISDGAERLACFDAAAAEMQDHASAETDAAATALKREFRFSPGLMAGPFTFKLTVSGSQQISRETAAAREVEQVVRRISKALSGTDNWSVAVTVHGAAVSLPRNTPYSGEELLVQARAGMARTGLPEERYSVEKGPDAEPVLWDDGRVRSPNEHIVIEVTGFDGELTR